MLKNIKRVLLAPGKFLARTVDWFKNLGIIRKVLFAAMLLAAVSCVAVLATSSKSKNSSSQPQVGSRSSSKQSPEKSPEPSKPKPKPRPKTEDQKPSKETGGQPSRPPVAERRLARATAAIDRAKNRKIITSEQADVLYKKVEELKQFNESLQKMDAKQRQEARAKKRQEIRQWLRQNNIEDRYFRNLL